MAPRQQRLPLQGTIDSDRPGSGDVPPAAAVAAAANDAPAMTTTMTTTADVMIRRP